MKCMVCGAEAPAGDRFCMSCGAALAVNDPPAVNNLPVVNNPPVGNMQQPAMPGMPASQYSPLPNPGRGQKGKKLPVIIIAVILVMVLCAAAVFIGVYIGRNHKNNIGEPNDPAAAVTEQTEPTTQPVTDAPVAQPETQTTAQPETQTAKPSVPSFSYNNGSTTSASSQLLFDSENQYITNAYLSQCTRDEVVIILNEMYARHGYIFKDAELREYFNSQSWYRGTEPSMEVAYSRFNAIERANVETIAAYQKSMGWR